jgi:ABC-type uncharacterized transport system permease subunit
LALTWAVPVGFMTMVPAQALSGELRALTLLGGVALALLLLDSSTLIRHGLRRYASASS